MVTLKEEKMLPDHPGYHESITGEEAERRLKSFGRNGYLTRYSKDKQSYFLSVFSQQIPEDEIMHFKIIVKKKQPRIDGKMKEFDDIKKLLKHYEENRIDPGLKTIGQKCTLEEFNQKEKERREREEQRRRCIIL